jgi:hypothetical protein
MCLPWAHRLRRKSFAAPSLFVDAAQPRNGGGVKGRERGNPMTEEQNEEEKKADEDEIDHATSNPELA